jgi:hypothetical protein
MPRFVVMVHEEYDNKWGFDADNIEHAKKLIEQVEEGELSSEELPNFYEKNYSIDTTIYEVEEVPNA